jgi:two-component system, chemotaxis family, chemotaxis protein CheY
MKILVVDDETVSQRKMELIMKYYGSCDRMEDGEAAVEAFVKAWEDWSPYDLITLDLVMPKMNGDATLTKIREMEKQKNVPEDRRVKVIMVTSQADKDTIVACIQAGCDDFISKPFDRIIIEEKLSRLFPQQQFKTL